MIRVLVSVRNAVEAQAALAGGADVIDIKEPSRGSLGAADVTEWPLIRQVVGRRAATSAALGELLHDDVERAAAYSAGLSWVKVGLAGCGRDERWIDTWRRLARALPEGVSLVAAAYADWRPAESPPIATVLEVAEQAGCGVLLVDTWDKTGGCLLDHFSADEVAQLCCTVQQRGMQIALAGSLGQEHLPLVRECGPDYLAVRGAVCRGSRVGEVDEQLVRRLSSALKKTQPDRVQVVERGA